MKLTKGDRIEVLTHEGIAGFLAGTTKAHLHSEWKIALLLDTPTEDDDWVRIKVGGYDTVAVSLSSIEFREPKIISCVDCHIIDHEMCRVDGDPPLCAGCRGTREMTAFMKGAKP